MTLAGVKTAQPDARSRGSGGRSSRAVVVARATLAMPERPAVGVIDGGLAGQGEDARVCASRSDLHVARRQRRRDALLGLGVLASALGATVAVLDVFH